MVPVHEADNKAVVVVVMTPTAMIRGVVTAIKAMVAKQVVTASGVVGIVKQGSEIRPQAHSKTIALLIQKAHPAHISPLVSPQCTKPLLVCAGFDVSTDLRLSHCIM